MEEGEILYKDLSYSIVGAAKAVYRELGHGFFEAIYRRSMLVEFRERGIHAEDEKHVPVYYHDELVGEQRLDVLVDEKIILELKAAKAIVDDHIAQALHYLTATRLRLAIIINFGPNGLETKRIVR